MRLTAGSGRLAALALAAMPSAPSLAQQASDSCAGAPLIQVNTLYSSSSINASSEIPGTCGFGDAFDVWYRFSAANAGDHFFTVRSSVIDPTVALYAACGTAFIACDDDSGGGGLGTDAEVALTMSPGQSVRIRIAANFGDDGAFTIFVEGPADPPPMGACCSGASCALTAEAACSGFATRWAGAATACNAPGNLTTPCCKGDFNQSGSVTVQDVFDFLVAYFAGDLSADTNGQDGVTVGDIFAFLVAYFGECV